MIISNVKLPFRDCQNIIGRFDERVRDAADMLYSAAANHMSEKLYPRMRFGNVFAARSNKLRVREMVDCKDKNGVFVGWVGEDVDAMRNEGFVEV